MADHNRFMLQSIEIAKDNIAKGGGPFGAVITLNNEVIATGNNQVTPSNDPTAHAEIVAIRKACKTLGTFSLDGCILYSSCEPCPMCLSAIYWANISKLYFGATKKDAGNSGFRDDFIYKELELIPSKRALKTTQILKKEAQAPFLAWKENLEKTPY